MKKRERIVQINDRTFTDPMEAIAEVWSYLQYFDEALSGVEITLEDIATRDESAQRAAAFGAIRRAVALARYYDKQADDSERQIINVVHRGLVRNPDYLCDVESGANNLFLEMTLGGEIRRAIRLAIGSPKGAPCA